VSASVPALHLVRRAGAPSVAMGATPHQLTDEGCPRSS